MEEQEEMIKTGKPEKRRPSGFKNGVIIGLVLLGIALINFVNMLVVKTVSRKGEFAVYESLGMTERIKKMEYLLET